MHEIYAPPPSHAKESPTQTCCPQRTNVDKIWPYSDHYVGDKDNKDRRNGTGENNWSGPESLESYSGQFLNNTLHGLGSYRWRHLDGQWLTYEGRAYANRRHGYGCMSYPDGRTYVGLYHNDVRWGPGVETHTSLRESVGLWRGFQLLRLTWKPDAVEGTTAVPDFTLSQAGAAAVARARVKLVTAVKELSSINIAFEKLKSAGIEPQRAQALWHKLYSTNGTDLKSVLCDTHDYDRSFYGDSIKYLQEEELYQPEVSEDNTEFSEELAPDTRTAAVHTYAAWNNSPTILHMMKHTYQHEDQRDHCLDLYALMSGPRSRFKEAAKHESCCRMFLMFCFIGDIEKVSKLVNEEHIHPDVADMQGNTGLIYATCGGSMNIVQFLLEAGAAVDAYNDSCCTALGLALMTHCALRLDYSPGELPQLFFKDTAHVPTASAEEWMINRDVLDSPTPKIKNKVSSKKSILSIRHDSDEFGEFDDVQLMEHSCLAYEELLDSTLNKAKKPAQYLLNLRDMATEAYHFARAQDQSAHGSDEKHAAKTPVVNMKAISEVMKSAGEISAFDVELDSSENIQNVKNLIEHLLSSGADPRRVSFPAPALALAVASGEPDLLGSLVLHGADVNQGYPELLGYRPIDMAIAYDWNEETLALITALLDSGAGVDHRLLSPEDPLIHAGDPVDDEPGPTLLHAIIARGADAPGSQHRPTLIELLLRHGCDVNAFFMGHSAVSAAMSQDLKLLDVFIVTSHANLNAAINDANHTILSRLLTPKAVRIDDLSTLTGIITNLMMYGVDPFQELQLGHETFGNIFDYTANISSHPETVGEGKKIIEAPTKRMSDSTNKKEKANKARAVPVTSHASMPAHSEWLARARQELMDSARGRLVRAAQARLLRGLAEIVEKYQHRAWHLIIPEHGASRAVGLWLTAPRGLEVWRVLQTSGKKMCRSVRVLRQLLCILRYYSIRNTVGPVTFKLKESIEKEVSDLLKEEVKPAGEQRRPWQRPIYYPELDNKINPLAVCFECLAPRPDARLTCKECRQVVFCTEQCREDNSRRFTHPCTQHLAAKHAADALAQAESDKREELAAADNKKQKTTRK